MVFVDVCNWMADYGVVGEFLRHNATNSLLTFFNVSWQ